MMLSQGIGLLIGIVIGLTAIWLSLVLIPSVLRPPKGMGLINITTKVWQLTDPTSPIDFLATYRSILSQLVGLAWYRTIQSVAGLLPLLLLYLAICQWPELDISLSLGATVGSLVCASKFWLHSKTEQTSNAN